MTYKSSLYPRQTFCKYFLQSEVCLFIFVTVSTEEQKFTILMKSNLVIFSFMFHVFYIIFKKYLPNLRSLKFSPLFSSRIFILFTQTFRSVIHFKLISVYGTR